MKCLKCNTELENNVIKCPNCGIRIGRLCPQCKTYNVITNKHCTNCNLKLLTICPECKSINLPNSKKCRKCSADLSSDVEVDVNSIEYNANYQTLSDAKETIIESINFESIKVISINGDNDYAKKYILKKILKETSESGIAWMNGKCTPHTQLTPLGYIQSVLLNLFNTPNFCTDKKQLKKESLKFFKQDFPLLSTSEVYDLLNILYPECVDDFINIKQNRIKTITIISKIFETVLSKMNAVLLVENIEYIDNFSYEILNYLLDNDFIRKKITFIISFSKEQSGINYFQNKNLSDESYKDISILPFTTEQLEPLFAPYKDLQINGDLKSKIIHFAKKDPILTEQLINLVADVNRQNEKIKLYDNLKQVLEYRLSLLKTEDYNSYLLLCASTILGYKFSPIILTSIFNMNNDIIFQTISKLVKLNYINKQNDIIYEFKTVKIWNILLEIFKSDNEIFRSVNQALYPLFSEYILSTYAIIGYVAQNLEFFDETIDMWMKYSSMVAYIGDIGLYIIIQKQILSIINRVKLPDVDIIKRNIYTELGLLLEENNPELTIEYLPKAINLYDESEISTKIELLGSLASASIKQNNYHGAIECIENVLKFIPDDNEILRAVVKSRKLLPLFLLGNSGEIINIAENEILPVMDKYLSNKYNNKILSKEDVFESYIKVYLNVIKASVINGDNRALKVIEILNELCIANKINDRNIWLEMTLLQALSYTISGDILISVKLLDEVLSEKSISDDKMSMINLIGILNKFFMSKDDLSYDDLFQSAQFADNIGDDFTKNILKIILGRLVQERTSAKEALKIYTNQVEYFAEKQNAIGVLLGWYFIASAKLASEGPNMALDIARKALDIAETVNISNQYFILLFNKLIGEAYLVMQDYDSANVYIEKAIIIAKKYNIKYQLVHLYLLYSRYLQDFALTLNADKESKVLLAKQMIKKASTIAEELKLISLNSEISKSKTVFNSFCQMNKIVLKSD